MQIKYSVKDRSYRGGFRGITPSKTSCRQMRNKFVNERKIFDKPDIVV
jgi:hypothetical protein